MKNTPLRTLKNYMLLCMILSIAPSCAYLKSDHFVKQPGESISKPILIGEQSIFRWHHGYQIHNVGQYEEKNFTIAWRGNRSLIRWWAVGLVFPIIPTFGIVHSNEADSMHGQFSVRIFVNPQVKFSVDPCQFVYQIRTVKHKVHKYGFSNSGSMIDSRECPNAEFHSIDLPSQASGHLIDLHLFFDETIEASKGTLQFPSIFVATREVIIPDAEFSADYRLIYGPSLF